VDAALETLFLPFTRGLLPWPAGGALFMRARSGQALTDQQRPGLVCEQTFKPEADALHRAGHDVRLPSASASTETYPLVLLLPPRQRDEARASMARALASTRSGGTLIACAANDAGARSAEADLARIAGPLETLTKNHCRVFWASGLQGPADAQLASQWLQLDAPRPICNGRFVSRPGVFAWDRIDTASALLAQHLPADLAGVAADLGAGFGYLAAELLLRCPSVTALDLYEAEARALDLARTNLAPFATRAQLRYHWHDVTVGLPLTYDVIVSNPPFHTQHGIERPDVGRQFLTAAAAALNEGGQFWLVANRHLPYESVLGEAFNDVRTVTQQHGYKVVTARKRARSKARR
jgi:16S rRNA (guanine1207-N2)-methyltransferase